MFDDSDMLEQPKTKSLNLIPIVDMFTTIVLFLVLSTSTYHYTKQTLPPSAISTTVAEAGAKKPLGLKVFAHALSPDRMRVTFQWQGEHPASRHRDFVLPRPYRRESLDALIKEMAEFTDEVSTATGPGERTIQISFQNAVPYQFFISTMDAVKQKFPDMVMGSPDEAEHLGAGEGIL